MALADTARLIASLELQDKFSRPAAGINRSLGTMERGFSQIGRGAGQVASGLDRLGTRAVLGAAAGIGAVVKTAIDFEDAFAGVRKTVDATDVELDAMFNTFRQMARETGIAVEEFSRIGQIAGALGVTTDAIDEFALAIAKASSATGLTVDELADSVGRLGNLLKLDESTYETFLSTVVELGNKGASTEAEILDIATRFAATGKAAGLSTPQILGLSSAIASIGLQPEAAGTSLSRIMANLISETANGTKKAKEFAKVAGVSFKEFAGIVEKDSLGAVLKFLAGLNEMNKLEKFQALKAAGITGARDRQTLLAFADGIGEVNRQLGVAQDEYGKTNALTEEFAKRQDTVAKQLAIVKENVRDVAFTLGENLLPIVSDLSKEFVAFLNLDATQTGIKTFAKDLAGGIRGLVTELKGTDFSGIIDGMKLAASVAKGAFDTFRSLPQPIQQLAIAALVANKVSGGAIGSIAGGLANILGGTIKLAFPKLDFFGRGSPLNPMFTKEVGLGGVAGGAPIAGGAAAAGGGLLRGVLAGASRAFGIGAAVYLGAELGKLVAGGLFEQTVAPAVKFEESQFQRFLNNPQATQDADIIAHNLEAIESELHDLAGNTVDPLERWLIPQLATLEEQRDILRDLLAKAPQAGTGNFVPTNPGGTPGTILPVKVTNAKEVGGGLGNEGERLLREGFAAMTLEQRLIKDATFKQQIGQSEFLRLLRKTSEFGAKGEGTTIEQGPKTGRDPLGDAFVALVKRVPKNLLTGEVYREVANHIIALEQVQKDLISEGKINAARHAQSNIDKLSALIGTVDRTRPILQRTAERTSALSARITEEREAIGRGFQATNDNLGISHSIERGILAKKTSFTANLTVPISTFVNSSLIQERIIQQRISTGTGFTEGLP